MLGACDPIRNQQHSPLWNSLYKSIWLLWAFLCFYVDSKKFLTGSICDSKSPVCWIKCFFIFAVYMEWSRMKECNYYTSILSPHAVCSVWNGSLLCPLIKKSKSKQWALTVLPFPFLQSNSLDLGDLKCGGEKVTFLFLFIPNYKKKTSHMVPKLTLHTERKRKGGDGIKRLFFFSFYKSFKEQRLKETPIWGCQILQTNRS